MSEQFRDLFAGHRPEPNFNRVIALHEESLESWDEIAEKIPLLPRGWYELARLPVEDRIEFTHGYWITKLPFIDGLPLEKRLNEFFGNLEEIGLYATQVKKGGAFDVHMVYGLKQGMGFFHGSPPASPATIEGLVKRFAHVNLPPDYLAFLQIHDGFSKYTDTGMIKIRDMSQIYQRLQHLLVEDLLVRADGQVIPPESLIPFYESFGLHCYQCFYAGWYPEREMGNVYFSEHDRAISNTLDAQALEENLAFPSFLSWLIFYLEDIWHL
jgi:hypothetical protein